GHIESCEDCGEVRVAYNSCRNRHCPKCGAIEKEDKKEIQEKIHERKEKQTKYKQAKKDLETSGEEQISLTDPDARAVILQRNIVNVGYNIQTSSDSKHKFLVEYDTGNVNDTNALADIAINTKEFLGVKHMNALADKGYHTGAEIHKCTERGIITYVSPKAPSTKDIGLYPITSFTYDPINIKPTSPKTFSFPLTSVWVNPRCRFRVPNICSVTCCRCL
ncbi:unnamed protein product, partial [marine sediment metagenome]